MSEFRTGFVGIVGPTNAGKSTLLNALVGQKVAIVSPKTQTTYHALKAVQSDAESQCIFTDTPGYQKFPDRIPRILNSVADREADMADALVWVFDASDKNLLRRLDGMEPKIKKLAEKKFSICVLNKVDVVRKDSLLPLLQNMHARGVFKEIIPISALKKDGIDRVRAAIRPGLPVGPALYGDDFLTDRNQQFLVSERIREQIYRATHQELPYSVWVEVVKWEKGPKCPVIEAVIHVDTVSRRKILIGKKASTLKNIGTYARLDIEALLGEKICLKLDVQIDRDWRGNKATLHRYLELS